MINATYLNATNTIYILSPLLLIIIGLLVIILLLYISNTIDKYRKFKKIIKNIKQITNYCLYGILTITVIIIPIYLGNTAINTAKSNPEGTIQFIKTISMIIGFIIISTITGYITKNRIWLKIWNYHKEEIKLKEYQKNMKELPINYEKT